MKSILTPTILALVLLAAGSVCWTLGQAEERIARMTRQVMTMGYQAVAEDAEPLDASLAYATRVPLVGDDLGSALRDDQASANYWLGRYDTLTLQRDSGGALVERDPQLLLFAANAAYRANELEPADRQTSIQRLQAIVTYYADLVKSHPELFDAAYNYEYTARLRSTLERSTRAPAPAAAEDKVQPAIHGQPGAPAKGAAANKLNIIVPKSGDERTNSPEAGAGGQRVRKG
jgi:hypothetical protein